MTGQAEDPRAAAARDAVLREEFVLHAEAVLAMAVALSERGSVPPEAAQVVAHARLVLGAFVD